jgi:hypothetical protein
VGTHEIDTFNNFKNLSLNATTQGLAVHKYDFDGNAREYVPTQPYDNTIGAAVHLYGRERVINGIPKLHFDILVKMPKYV